MQSASPEKVKSYSFSPGVTLNSQLKLRGKIFCYCHFFNLVELNSKQLKKLTKNPKIESFSK